ncbi:GNAT family N-acetyltransferase [Halobacterium yunchengense]|uniref:GNAT family N-acetyltransferase n=1 Tax=Halobacterium yunchengense TaxID=3108497 RepID=UPI003009EF52
MVELRRVTADEFDDVLELHHECIDDRDRDVVREWYDEHPALFWGAWDGDDLVGFALGRHREAASVELVGIAVRDAYARAGVGSRLLEAFEDAAREYGFERASVGSAGGYVDYFYAANGYRPESIMVRTSREALPENYRERFDVRRERSVDGGHKVYLAPGGDADGPVDHDRVERVRAAFDDPDAIYIMEKSLHDG